MKLDLKFYNSNPVLPGAVPNNATGITVAFDQTNDQIGINNYWFGSNHLPLSGGQMTGPIRFGIYGANTNAAIVLNSKPIIADHGSQSGNDYRYLFRYTDGMELGNHHMYLRLLTDNKTGNASQDDGKTGDVWHYISSNNAINGTISKYIMLDARNSSITGIQSGDYVGYGYTLKLGYTEANILGAGKLNPSITWSTGADAGVMTLNIGGEEVTTNVTAKYAVSAGAAATLAANTLYINSETGNSVTIVPGNTPQNKIILDEGLIATKVAATGGTSITANPKSWNIKISIDYDHLNLGEGLVIKTVDNKKQIAIDPNLLRRISDLESRHDVMFETNKY